MARLLQSGFELNSLTADVEWTVLQGTIATSNVRTGTYASEIKITGSNAFKINQYILKSTTTAGKFYLRVYIYIVSYPATNCEMICFYDNSTSSANKINILMTTTGVLRLRNNNTQIGSDSSALSLNTQYRIEMECDCTTLASTIADGSINGVSFASGTVSISFGVDSLRLGNANTGSQYDIYFDDVAVNDGGGSSQNAYPIGAGQIIHLQPNAAGDNNAFAVQVGGTAGSANNYTRVNEVTPDDATSYNADVTSGDIDDFNITDTPSSIGSSDTINCVMIGVRYTAAVAAAEAAFVVRCKKTSGGTVSESAAITPNSTTWFSNANANPRTYPLILYNDPDGSAWTKSTLDTAQIGYRISTTNTNAAQISTIWMSIDSTPVVAPAATSVNDLLMMFR